MNNMDLLLGHATGLDHSSGELLPVWESSRGEDKILPKRILLVEDESFVRASIGRLLSKDEHTVVEANNGAEALSDVAFRAIHGSFPQTDSCGTGEQWQAVR